MKFKLEDIIIFEDEHIVALNKPSGLLAIPDREGKEDSLKKLLKNKYGEIFVVHRLDRDTSGIIVFARKEEMHKRLSLQFENRETKKIYHGLVIGKPSEPKGVINEPIAEHSSKKGLMTVHKRGKESITEYELLEGFRLYSWMQFQILTGRTHQIRVHMKHLGYPLVCDELYGDGKPVFISQLKKKYNLSKSELEERPLLNRLALHALQLSFKGIKGKDYNLEAPPQKDLKAVLNQLRKITPSSL